MVRGLNPWPSAYTYYQGKILKIWSASVEPDTPGQPHGGAEPGTVVRVTGDAVWVAAGSGSLRMEELQAEGKKRMKVKDFLLGCRLSAGEKLGR
jgi:methionyl-tRNA formyltransferase